MILLDKIEEIRTKVKADGSTAIILVPSSKEIAPQYMRLLFSEHIYVVSEDIIEGVWKEPAPDYYRIAAIEVHQLHVINIGIEQKSVGWCRTRVRRLREDNRPLEYHFYFLRR